MAQASIDKIDLLNALSFHTQTLRVLDFDVDDEFWDSPTMDRYDDHEEDLPDDGQEDSANWKEAFGDYQDHQILSLTDLPALTSLSIAIKFLAAIARGRARDGQSVEKNATLVEILPPNLEHLRIRGYNPGADAEDDAQAASLIEMSRTRLRPKT